MPILGSKGKVWERRHSGYSLERSEKSNVRREPGSSTVGIQTFIRLLRDRKDDATVETTDVS